MMGEVIEFRKRKIILPEPSKVEMANFAFDTILDALPELPPVFLLKLMTECRLLLREKSKC